MDGSKKVVVKDGVRRERAKASSQKETRDTREKSSQKERVPQKEKAPREEIREKVSQRETREKLPQREPREETREKDQTNKVVTVKSIQEYTDLRNYGLVVVDFNTSWCGPCKTFAPIFDEIAENYPGVKFLSVDAESIEHEDTESVKSVPTFKIFLNGLLKREFSGIDREKLELYIERYHIQILINGRTQRSFPEAIREKIVSYMSMLEPE